MSKIKIFKSFFQDRVCTFQIRTRSDLEQHQAKKLKLFLGWLSKKSPFYRDYAGVNFSEWPIMNKQIMMENFSKINTLGLERDELLAFVKQTQEKKDFTRQYRGITVGLSSGTTGKPSLFIADQTERAVWAGIILSKALKNLDFKKQKIAFCFRSNSALYETIQSKIIDFYFLDIALGVEEIAENLRLYQPSILVAPAQVLNRLMGVLEPMEIQPIRVFSVAEVLEPHQEEKISIFFKQKIFQIYQCSEGFLGITAPNHKGIVLNEEYVFFEKEWLDETRFVPIITDFSRTSQPIVRYRLTDVLVEDFSKRGEYPFTILKAIEGRCDDVLYFEKKNQSLVPVFADSIRLIMSVLKGLNDYRIEQHDLDELSLFLDPFDVVLSREVFQNLFVFFEKNDLKTPKINFKKMSKHDPQKKYRRIQRCFKLEGDR